MDLDLVGASLRLRENVKKYKTVRCLLVVVVVVVVVEFII